MRRGTVESIEATTAPIVIQPGRARFEIALPDDYPDGPYSVAIVDPFDRVLIETAGVAVDHVFAVFADARRVEAGRKFLRIAGIDHAPDYVPITVGQP